MYHKWLVAEKLFFFPFVRQCESCDSNQQPHGCDNEDLPTLLWALVVRWPNLNIRDGSNYDSPVQSGEKRKKKTQYVLM